MKPEQRQEWIKDWIKDKIKIYGPSYSVNHLDSDFVCEYADECTVKIAMQFVGAPHCPTLRRDLCTLHTQGYLSRNVVGLGDGFSAMGFPKWVYDYRLTV